MAPTPDPPKPRKQRGEPQASILTDAKALAEEVELLEAQINVLRARYEQFFLGMDKRPPVQEHDQFKRRMLPLRQPVVRNSAIGFRIQTLQEKVAIYERMWNGCTDHRMRKTNEPVRNLAKIKILAGKRALAGFKMSIEPHFDGSAVYCPR